jgi:hypothetical protein
VSAVVVLLGLLVVAFVGSQLMGTRAAGYGLASGVEYLLLGVVLGPYALGLVERSTLASFEPLAAVGTAWLTLVIGADYGFVGPRRVRARGFLCGVVLSLVSVSATAIIVRLVASRVTELRGQDLFLVSVGIGLVSCETTRHAVRWVVSRYSAEGPLTILISEIADSDDLVPILGLMASFTALGGIELPMELQMPWWGWSVVTLLLGLILGATAAALLRAEPRASDGWGVMLGAALLGIGISWRLGMSPQTVTFAIGLTLSAMSRHGVELRTMLGRAERPILLPTLVLAGAQVRIEHGRELIALSLAALVARIAVRLLAAPVVAVLAGAPAGVGPSLAVGLLPTGALTITIGLVFAMRFPGQVGDIVLGVAAGFTMIGELVGPASLRRALERAGEIEPPPPSSDALPEASS